MNSSFTDLQELSQTIKQKASEYGLYIVEAPISFRWVPSHIDINWEGDWTEYLELARKVMAPILYLECQPFNLDEQNAQTLVAQMSTNTWQDEEQGQWLAQRLDEETVSWRAYNGVVHQVQAVWLKEGVAHWLELGTNWWGEYRRAVSRMLEEAKEVKEENRRIHSKEEAQLLLERAKQLASHERFGEATSVEKREYMAQQLFPDLLGSYAAREVSSVAVAVYWWEVEPRALATKEEKARELRARGESIKNIAALLKMSEAKVRTAVEQVDSQSEASNTFITEQAQALRKSGESIKNIATYLGIPESKARTTVQGLDARDKLIDSILVEIWRVWQGKFNGTEAEYQWLVNNYGISEEDDSRLVLILEQQEGKSDRLAEYEDNSEVHAFLGDNVAITEFLTTMLRRYKSNDISNEQLP
jgi:hypothetical protein